MKDIVIDLKELEAGYAFETPKFIGGFVMKLNNKSKPATILKPNTTYTCSDIPKIELFELVDIAIIAKSVVDGVGNMFVDEYKNAIYTLQDKYGDDIPENATPEDKFEYFKLINFFKFVYRTDEVYLGEVRLNLIIQQSEYNDFIIPYEHLGYSMAHQYVKFLKEEFYVSEINRLIKEFDLKDVKVYNNSHAVTVFVNKKQLISTGTLHSFSDKYEKVYEEYCDAKEFIYDSFVEYVNGIKTDVISYNMISFLDEIETNLKEYLRNTMDRSSQRKIFLNNVVRKISEKKDEVKNIIDKEVKL